MAEANVTTTLSRRGIARLFGLGTASTVAAVPTPEITPAVAVDPFADLIAEIKRCEAVQRELEARCDEYCHKSIRAYRGGYDLSDEEEEAITQARLDLSAASHDVFMAKRALSTAMAKKFGLSASVI